MTFVEFLKVKMFSAYMPALIMLMKTHLSHLLAASLLLSVVFRFQLIAGELTVDLELQLP